ncbi:MAG: hypothetical protein AAF081_18660 [Actinomycetota bacterium]
MREFATITVAQPDYPRVVYVHQGLLADDRTWFPVDDPHLIAIEDPDADLYAAFTVRRGGRREMFGLRAWWRGAIAFVKGNRIGRKVGDGWTLPTIVGIDDGHIVWRHDGEHAGDHPDLGMIPVAMGV